MTAPICGMSRCPACNPMHGRRYMRGGCSLCGNTRRVSVAEAAEYLEDKRGVMKPEPIELGMAEKVKEALRRQEGWM